ncbi:MAG TPA: response regulator [Pyrinomonadaceae bacterium]|jgi:two-component system chemotaxis response regulator CheY|nr:response regulator [Pyrinomonadaceae bacterium]
MKKIMVVDDAEIWRRLSFNLLSEAGFRVVEADSGESAIELARSSSPLDLVVMDFGMPRLNGIDTARHLRAISGYESIPIILLTGEKFPGDCEHPPAPFVDGYVDKKHVSRQLVDCVKLHLDAARSHA